uniref:Coat protein n=1 Tax=Grapevine leafroll-associated virus 3 TaxID=55951 RepID=J7G154_9CLOS|nr:coat protein [Grapevine leafroll-associated virus 3]AFP55715.1 coat protein [Grapevine leafroll-associated virus 3]AFP55721.1 coat protein [Grapevine leafroll-associated virus 3]
MAFELKLGQIYEVVPENNLRVRVGDAAQGKFSKASFLKYVKDGTQAELTGIVVVPEKYVFATAALATAAQEPPKLPQAQVAEPPEAEIGVVPESETLTPNKLVFEKDPDKFLKTMGKGIALDLTGVTHKPKVINEPGKVSVEVAMKINAALMELCKKVMGADDAATKTKFSLYVMQIACTFFTSSSTEFKEFDYIETDDGKKIYAVWVYDCIKQAAASTGYENPVRQYLAYFTPTFITATLNGKLVMNEKVMAQHGVPPKFFPYTIDCVRPTYDLFNNDAILAWNLARQQAFRNKTVTADNTLHNVFQVLQKN